MKGNWIRVMVMGGLVWAAAAQTANAQKHRIGGGVHYWRTVDDLEASDFDVDEDGLAYLVSYQFIPAGLFKLQADFEIFPEDFGNGDDMVYAPQAFAILGSGLYAGLGIGTFIFDGEIGEDPFYVLRAGIDLEILPSLHLDINANYNFTSFDDIRTVDEDVDTDTITLGAMIRLEL